MRTQLGPIQGVDGRARPGLDRYVLEPGGALDRAPDLTGLTGTPLQDAIDDFIAGETLVGYYPDEETGSVSTAYPLITDNEGRCPDAWFDPGSYDHYVPDDLVNPLERWEAIAFAGVELNYAQITEPVTQTGVGTRDVPGLTLNFTAGQRPVGIRVSGAALGQSSSGGITYARLLEGTTVLDAQPLSLTLVTQRLSLLRRLSPLTPGSVHTVKVTLQQLLSGNSTIYADPEGPSAAYGPASIHAYEL